MTEQIVKPIKTTPTPPLQLYQQTFCRHCTQKCGLNTTAMQNCILTLIADETVRLRQLLDKRTQHLGW